MPRRIVILGCTGSIGEQSFDVVRESIGGESPLQIVGLSAGSSWQALLSSASEFSVQRVHLADDDARVSAQNAVDGSGINIDVCASVGELIDRAEPDLVLNAIVGVAGLEATLAALSRGVSVALANKESLVAAGQLCMQTAADNDAQIIPVDSEHSALAQCMGSSSTAEIESLVLTASGGPFRGKTRDDLAHVTVEQALDHPTWNMGGKITIDSATLMNKGLELIEAMVLFDLPVDQIETIVHPDSIVHSLVRHRDGSLLAHLGWPDMRVPIAWALQYPVRPPLASARRLDLAQMPALVFEEPDLETFRCLALAREAGAAGGAAPCVMNSANEVAVAQFMAGEIPFLSIANVVQTALDEFGSLSAPQSIDDVVELDRRARNSATSMVVKSST